MRHSRNQPPNQKEPIPYRGFFFESRFVGDFFLVTFLVTFAFFAGLAAVFLIGLVVAFFTTFFLALRAVFFATGFALAGAFFATSLATFFTGSFLAGAFSQVLFYDLHVWGIALWRHH